MSDATALIWTVRAATIVAIAAIISAGLIVVLRPWLRRYALARPNARSSHREPTPQGGGIAVITATIVTAWLAIVGLGAAVDTPLAIVGAATIVMACVGAADDIRPLGVAPRLLLQALAVAAMIHALPDDLRVVPILPWWIERALLFAGALWFVNLVNFMDGIDWMTAAEVVPVATALAVIGILGAIPLHGTVVALALGGATIGFAYFNQPVAKLFLGDVGSLPIGLVLAWLLILVAGNGHLAAAMLLPLYYLADATITLARRLLNGERIWEAHRTHFYQRATDRGFSVMEVVTRVFVVNLLLAALAIATTMMRSMALNIAALLGGAVLVGYLLAALLRGRSRPQSSM